MPEHFEGNSDDLIRQMQLDDLEGASKLTPIEYARMRNMKPQLVYYHIRAGHIEIERCQCGRKVVDVKLSDEYFGKGEFDPNYMAPEED